MSKIDYQALREKAEKATSGEWSLEYGEGRFDGDDALIHREVAGYIPICRIEGAHPESGFDEDFQMEQQANAEFIAAANPATVLALLDERESQNKRIAELEKSEEQLINERDHAESALDDMYFAATGNRPEWSNWFGFSDAVDAVVDRIADLEAKQPSPVVPEEKPIPNPLSMYAVDAVAAIAEVRGWNACRAAMLHSAEPASNHEELPLDYLQGQKDGLEWAAQLAEANHPQTGDWLYDDPLELAKAIRKGPDMPEFDGPTPVTPDGWISCSERMPVIGELNWRTSFPLLITCEIGVIPAYYGFVSVNGDRHYGFMESLKYGDDSGGHPQTNEYGLISNVTHWMQLPEPPQEAK
ncbi:DUF551 domain-containing protein [Escherichia coli]|nr:DUF551 domain-containing protein [Escherichia coli]EIY3325511.1 ead/Ea22-like family protein [Escherichia coli]EIY3350621.1 ead/Ea22-like family protein [Escherichia coli]